MNAKLSLAAIGLLVAGLVTGCGRGGSLTTPATSSDAQDQAEVAAALAAAPETVDEPLFESPEVTGTTAGSAFAEGALAPIRPLRFWRHIENVERRFEFAWSDTDSTGRPTRAVVTVHRNMRGTFNIAAVAASDEGGTLDTTVSLLRKPLADHGVRRILMKRVRHHEGERARWRVAATSGVQITSRPQDAAPVILSLRVEAAGLDTTITDPLAFFFLRRTLKLDPGAEVKLTATTASPDDVVLLMRIGRRARMQNQGDGTHTAAWMVGDEAGFRHLGVNVLSRGTLYDDEAPYASRAWVLPYVVRGEELMAEFRP